eukprot:361967-Chlamydomonas_euryale.AAC.1
MGLRIRDATHCLAHGLHTLTPPAVGVCYIHTLTCWPARPGPPMEPHPMSTCHTTSYSATAKFCGTVRSACTRAWEPVACTSFQRRCTVGTSAGHAHCEGAQAQTSANHFLLC